MKYLLDTNNCIHFFRGKYNLFEKIDQIGLSNCAISEITLAELVFGAEMSSNSDKNYKLIEDFSKLVTIIPIYDSIYLYAKEKSRLRQKGTIISDFDIFIACTAVENKLIMVTENIKEFKRISHIKLENWVDRNI